MVYGGGRSEYVTRGVIYKSLKHPETVTFFVSFSNIETVIKMQPYQFLESQFSSFLGAYRKSYNTEHVLFIYLFVYLFIFSSLTSIHFFPVIN